MKFKTIEPTTENINTIAQIVLKKGGTKVMASTIIDAFINDYKVFVKEFDYYEYVATKEPERIKYNFLPTDASFINGNEYDNRAFKSIIKEINNIILYSVINMKKRKAEKA